MSSAFQLYENKSDETEVLYKLQFNCYKLYRSISKNNVITHRYVTQSPMEFSILTAVLDCLMEKCSSNHLT